MLHVRDLAVLAYLSRFRLRMCRTCFLRSDPFQVTCVTIIVCHVALSCADTTRFESRTSASYCATACISLRQGLACMKITSTLVVGVDFVTFSLLAVALNVANRGHGL